jgi:5-methylcytosine-specific restriction endonuclease McrA
MNLASKSDRVLLSELKTLVQEERRATLKVLHYLQEIETRKTHIASGFPSLFEYCVRELGYSEGAAYRRLSAMRLIRALPEAEARIESGSISLTVAAHVENFFRDQTGVLRFSTSEKRAVLAQMENVSSRECQRKLMALAPTAPLPREVARPVAEGQTMIQFVADAELFSKLERLKDLLAHRNYRGEYARLFHQLADIALEKLDPSVRRSRNARDEAKTTEAKTTEAKTTEAKTTEAKTTEAKTTSMPMRSRFISVKIRREVWLRDTGRCQYREPSTGLQCRSTHALQFDHIVPWCRGGTSSAQNLRLLCATHNQFRAWKMGLRSTTQEDQTA